MTFHVPKVLEPVYANCSPNLGYTSFELSNGDVGTITGRASFDVSNLQMNEKIRVRGVRQLRYIPATPSLYKRCCFVILSKSYIVDADLKRTNNGGRAVEGR